MALIDTYRNDCSRKQAALASLQKKKGDLQAKIASARKKRDEATRTLSRTKSDSTRRSKQRAIESANREEAKLAKDLANIEAKLASATKSLNDAKNKLDKEEKKVADKQAKVQKAINKRNADNIERIIDDVSQQAAEHESLQRRVEMLEALPEQITVLYLTSVPDGVETIHTDREAREIREAITKALHRDSIIFETRAAVRTSDLFQALNETRPTIVHFSGHGTEEGELIFESASGSPNPVTPEQITAVLSTMADSVRLVVFNACFSEAQAREVTSNIEAAIGMGDSIDDRTAIEFAAQLYSAIGFGLSLDQAFSQARASIVLAGLPGADTPELFTSEEISASEVVYVGVS